MHHLRADDDMAAVPVGDTGGTGYEPFAVVKHHGWLADCLLTPRASERIFSSRPVIDRRETVLCQPLRPGVCEAASDLSGSPMAQEPYQRAFQSRWVPMRVRPWLVGE